MSASAAELLDLVARWMHVIAGIMWVGNSLLFNWLDRNLTAHPDQTAPESLRSGGKQSIWLLHSGGFYFVEKTLLPGQKIPAPLHWFKWQAYTTWLTGFALLIIVYWAGGRATMEDPSVLSISHRLAVIYGVGAIFGGILLYEIANRAIARVSVPAALVVWVAGLLAISYGLVHSISGRAAFLHVGAMLATIMAGNVFLTIVPSQRQLVAAVENGRQAEAGADSARAKRVSIHNNYFTFPVIVLMVSSHFPSLYGAQDAWAILLVLIAGGAAVRHVLNTRYTTRHWQPTLGAVMIATVGLIAVFARQAPLAATQTTDTTPVAFTEVRRVIDRRCAACHSATPSDLTFGAAPVGVMFDTPEQIASHIGRIEQRAVILRTMPPANKTNITDAERAMIGRWIAQGAPIH